MFIFVDHELKKIRLELWEKSKLLNASEYPLDHHASAEVLNCFAKFIGDNHLHLQDLKGIVIAKGPGSFTALRVIISTFNTLARVLDIPIVGVKKGLKFSPELVKGNQFQKPVLPFYGTKPKTTKPKKGS
jgi:tRNA A37 threonylcarbamoyladenosine modification protein TsaB